MWFEKTWQKDRLSLSLSVVAVILMKDNKEGLLVDLRLVLTKFKNFLGFSENLTLQRFK